MNQKRRREIPLTDLGLSEPPGAAKPAALSLGGWEGPRFHFPHLLGEGAIWDGPHTDGQEPLDFCGGRDLESHQYCLGCDRSGRELDIPGVGEVRRRRAYRRGRLRGGKS